MVLDILMDVGLAVEDHQVFVSQMPGQPVGGDPLHEPVAFSIGICFFHYHHPM
jgi:hypothetical protein